MFNFDSFLPDFNKVIDRVKSELTALRTGRANAAILDAVQVEAYGQRMPLKGVASISLPDARTLVVEPWDKGLLKEVEKAIIDAQIGLQPINEGKFIRLTMPMMTEESRKELLKILGQKLEQGRISLRQLRDSLRDKIFQEEKAKLIGEDQRFKLQEKLDEKVKEHNEKLKKMGEEKEKEIMTI